MKSEPVLPESTEKLQTLLAIGKLLLDEERLQIVGLLARQAYTAEELLALLPFKANKLTRHLKQLSAVGLAAVERQDGTENYRLDVERVQSLKKELFAPTVEASPQTPEDKVLAGFIQEGRLTHLPARPAKLMVVLDWLADRFQWGVDYPEREVNEVLKRHFDDYATLRRLLIDYGRMARQAGIYRRVQMKDTQKSG